MKRIFVILAAVIMILFTSSCANPSLDTGEKIVSPLNNALPIEGKWEIFTSPSADASLTNEVKDELIGKSVQFSSSAVMIGEHIWKSPNYKIKKVKTDEYLVSRYELSKENIKINEKESYVITVTSDGTFICEFLKIDSKEMIGFIQNNIYHMKKVSDGIDTSFVKMSEGDTKSAASSYTSVSSGQHKTGVMLGLRYPKGSSKNSIEYGYRTFWISANDGTLNPVLETKDIFFPRKSGFWKLESVRVKEADKVEDVLIAYNTAKVKSSRDKNIRITPSRWSNRKGSIYRKIYYIGNDYVSFETNGSGKNIDNGQRWQDNRLQLQPIDNIATMRGVKISDLFGENGLAAMESAKDELIEELNGRNMQEVNISDNEENFGLVRKTGHWYFKGRFNYIEGGNLSYMDYYINLIPPVKLVFYDSLHIAWRDIKDKVPEAVDAFTSPNKDIAIITTRNKINIYAINNGKLGESPLKSIPLKDGEMVIMAEWASGSYVENWESSFISNIEK